MSYTEINSYDIAHVKVDFNTLPKIYAIPTIGRFVWIICFVKCAISQQCFSSRETSLFETWARVLFPEIQFQLLRSESQHFPWCEMFMLCGKMLWFFSQQLWKKGSSSNELLALKKEIKFHIVIWTTIKIFVSLEKNYIALFQESAHEKWPL